MTTRTLDFKELLGSVQPSRFFDTYWEQKPLHLQRTSEFYSHLLSIAELERLIASPDVRYPAIQLSKGGTYFPPEVYCDAVQVGAVTFTGVPNAQKLANEYRAGATIVLPALHRTWAPLTETCNSIEAELDHVVHANAYLTPGNTAGFSPHYDTHEVFVLQLAGRKHWRIYEPPIDLPHRKQPFDPTVYVLPEKPLLDAHLQSGDLLYLPRGYVHTTTTSDEYSAHVTLGVAVYTWLDLAGEVLQSAMNSSSFRKALPPGFAHRRDKLPTLRTGLAEMLQELGQEHAEARLVETFLSRMRASPAWTSSGFRADVNVIALSTLLEAPVANDFLVVAEGNKVAVEFRSRRFILPVAMHTILEFMRQQRQFRTSDLPTVLDIETKLSVVRSLYDKGFLTLVKD